MPPCLYFSTLFLFARPLRHNVSSSSITRNSSEFAELEMQLCASFSLDRLLFLPEVASFAVLSFVRRWCSWLWPDGPQYPKRSSLWESFLWWPTASEHYCVHRRASFFLWSIKQVHR